MKNSSDSSPLFQVIPCSRGALRRLCIVPIKLYRLVISPLFPQTCRFYPTCSQYMECAILKYGIIRGLGLGIRRIAKCHPWHPGGYDPLP